MIIRFDPVFVEKLKKVNVRIRNNFKLQIKIFAVDPDNPQLNNHPLRDEWQGYRSININSDRRAIYAEKNEGVDEVAYFIAIGTHDELYPPR